MSAPSLLVALAQLPGRAPEAADPAGILPARVARARAAVASARAAGAALVLLPEAFLPGYTHAAGDARDAAETLAREGAEAGISVAVGFLDGGDRTRCALGLATPGGGWWVYHKRFPSPDERRVWAAGTGPTVADTPLGRVGLLLCADVLQRSVWEELRGRVDLVVVAAAWPDYRGREAASPPWLRPVVRWLAAESAPYRDDLLARAAVRVGAPVVFTNAVGTWRGEEGFAGGSGAWEASGRRVVLAGHTEAVVLARVGWPTALAGEDPLRHPWRWELLTRAWRAR